MSYKLRQQPNEDKELTTLIFGVLNEDNNNNEIIRACSLQEELLRKPVRLERCLTQRQVHVTAPTMCKAARATKLNTVVCYLFIN